VAGLVGCVAILLGAVITYRITTDKGELVVVVETEDPDIEVIVKRGGEQITIIDPQTKKQIELPSGKYELELAGDKPGLSLSKEEFTLKRGDKTVVTVRREAPVPSAQPNKASDPPVGTGTTLSKTSPETMVQRFRPIDLQPHANVKLTENVGNPGNTLERLPTGKQTFAGIPFAITGGSIQLASQSVAKPERVEGIKVGGKFIRLHFLHATHAPVDAETTIGSYTVNYTDGSQETIPLVYGKDLCDWWYYENSPLPTRAKVGWEGTNEDASNQGAKIRLYVMTWTNPAPEKAIASLDLASNSTVSAPFCVAITAEK
jgi:hypothetical protein